MTKFQCLRSGNFVEFSNENDIDAMRKHEGYKEVKNVETSETVETEPQKAPTKEVLSLRGRPKKNQVPAFLQE